MAADGPSIGVLILAAGKGSRMLSKIPKVLHKVAGQAMLEYVLQSIPLPLTTSIVIVGSDDLLNNAEFMILAQRYKANVALQSEQLGTAHAVSCGMQNLSTAGEILILYGDVPLLKSETLDQLLKEYHDTDADLMVIGFHYHSPNDYGKFVLENDKLVAIVEDKNATSKQKESTFCNSGIMICSSHLLNDFLAKMNVDSLSGEYYLTDIISFASEHK